MKEYLILNFALIFHLLHFSPTQINAQPDTLIQFLAPFIGEWHTIPNPEMSQNATEVADMVGFKFEWGHDNQKIIHFYEGIPKGNMEKRILENLVAVNPRTGSVEFLGYQMRNDFLFKGRFEPLVTEAGFIRLYDVYYPHGTKFKHKADEMKGMKSYRDICRLIGSDTLECTTEQFDFGQWKPWGNAGAYRLVRRSSSGQKIPQWLQDNWAERTRGDGIWITDNSAYQSDQEPFDAYGMAWEYGLGSKYLKGRLYCIREGKDVGTVWQFTEYWDPEKGEVRVMQIGSDGTIGQGKIWQEDNGRIKEQQTFASPGGDSFLAGHLAWMANGAQHTQSYDIINGEWKERRFYIWQPREKTLTKDTPVVYKDLAFLIGEWHSSFGDARAAKMKFEWAENNRMIKYQNSYRPQKEAPYQMESQGIISYHGVKDQVVFMTTYMSETSHLMAEGYYEVDEKGTIHRHFTCFYKEGDKLPWSDGAIAPKGGKRLEFKQIWTPIDGDTFTGDFFWKKDGKWAHPIKSYDEKETKEVWRRAW